VELKTALSNFQKDRYVSSMMREELEAIMKALEQPQTPPVPLATIEEKLSEALALLKGERAPANSKSRPKSRNAHPRGAGEAAPVAAKAKP
jgi:hypothetical protein